MLVMRAGAKGLTRCSYNMHVDPSVRVWFTCGSSTKNEPNKGEPRTVSQLDFNDGIQLLDSVHWGSRSAAHLEQPWLPTTFTGFWASGHV